MSGGVYILTYWAGPEDNRRGIWICYADDSELIKGGRPKWHYNRRVGSMETNRTRLNIQMQAMSKQYQMPAIAPMYDLTPVTLAQLRALPQTDEVKALGVKLAFLESRLGKQKQPKFWTPGVGDNKIRILPPR